VGRTGSGKTFALKAAVEALLNEGARVCILDPTGVWYGLRSNAKGTGPGFPVVVFGGDHADVPIVDTSGEALAELVATKNVPIVVDLSEFTMGGRTRFATRFLEDLYRRNRLPLTLVVDESDVFAPQRVQPDEMVMLSRMEQICRRGRVRGFRVWLITQRPAALSKAVLSQANTLIAMQLTAPQDRAAVGAWIEGQADKERGKQVLAELPRLKRGEGFVWSPSHDILERVKFPPITTFDTGKTPVEGEKAPVLKLAEIDLASIGESFKQAEAEASANDPKRLRARIAELERALKSSGKDFGLRAAVDLRNERNAGYLDGERDTLALAKGVFTHVENALIIAVRKECADAVQLIGASKATPKKWVPDAKSMAAKHAVDAMQIANAEGLKRGSAPRGNGATAHAGATLNAAQRKFLTVLAQRQGKATSRNQVALFAGYSSKSAHVDNVLSSLRAAAYAEGRRGDIRITDAGLAALGEFEPLPSGDRLRDYWMLEAGGAAEAAFLKVVFEAYPGSLTRDEIAQRAGYSTTSAHVDNVLSRLRSLDLITGGRSAISASGELFE
jgi:hypothetical protein